MPAHQHGLAAGQLARQIVSHLEVDDHQVGRIAKAVGDVPHRHLGADQAAHVRNRAQRHGRDAERDDFRAVVVDHRADVGPRGVDRGMDEAFDVRPPALWIERYALAVEFHQVFGGHERGCPRARHDEMARVCRVPATDVAQRVDHAFVR